MIVLKSPSQVPLYYKINVIKIIFFYIMYFKVSLISLYCLNMRIRKRLYY